VDTPENTLLVVLQVVSLILALLVFVGARQARHKEGVGLWAIAFAIHAVSQFLREFASLYIGHNASLPISVDRSATPSCTSASGVTWDSFRTPRLRSRHAWSQRCSP
jgi:hypothetical protein